MFLWEEGEMGIVGVWDREWGGNGLMSIGDRNNRWGFRVGI